MPFLFLIYVNYDDFLREQLSEYSRVEIKFIKKWGGYATLAIYKTDSFEMLRNIINTAIGSNKYSGISILGKFFSFYSSEDLFE